MEAKAYEVLARRWRPQQFGDVVGQDHVTRTLRNAIESNRLAHAYLFVGPRGVGKTSIARILAKALNCRRDGKPTVVPCDACESCREIMAGGSLDVLEIDGASNNGVEQVRDLRDSVRYRPARGPYKIYIIDEVHMLSIGAFNALLKTLEEPPDYVKFMFATTEPQKVPATILSRCQRFDLRSISTKEMVAHLAKIAKAEKIKVDDAALLAIARGAEGGMRDAESALDQLIAFCGRDITEDSVLSVFGLVAWKNLEDLVDAVLDGKIPALLQIVAELHAAGKDLQRLSVELLDYFRNLLVMAHAGDLMNDREWPDAQLAALRRQVAKVPPERLAAVVEVLIEAQGQIRHALARRTILEVALIRATRTATVATIDEILAFVQNARAALPDAPPPAAPSPPAARRVDEPGAAPAPPPGEPPPRAPASDDLRRLVREWPALVGRIGAAAPLIRSQLKDTRPVAVEGDRLVIGIDPEFAQNRAGLEAPRSVKAIQQAVRGVIGRDVAIEVRELDPAEREGLAAAQPEDETPSEPPPKKDTPRRTPADWSDDPVVRRAIEEFNGSIIDVRE